MSELVAVTDGLAKMKRCPLELAELPSVFLDLTFVLFILFNCRIQDFWRFQFMQIIFYLQYIFLF